MKFTLKDPCKCSPASTTPRFPNGVCSPDTSSFACYVVFALGKLPGMKIDRPGAAIIGAVAMLAFRSGYERA
jgi:hypothetical protein